MSEILSVAILTYRRDDALALTLDQLAKVLDPERIQLILVDNNDDGMDRGDVLEGFPHAVYITEHYNMGVTAGRNRAIRAADGDVILFLDDDAILEAGADFQSDLVARFERDPTLGAVAFRSFVGKDRIEEDREFPHTNKKLGRDKAFDTFRFIGVAHAVRRALFEKSGPYCSSFFYGMEEFDMAYRFLKLGYRIEYRPEFSVRHMKAETGRLPSAAVIRRMFANKLAVGWMHLPMAVFLRSAAAWFVKTAIDSRSAVTPIRSIGDFLAMASHGQIERRRPSPELVAEIRRLGGAPWR